MRVIKTYIRSCSQCPYIGMRKQIQHICKKTQRIIRNKEVISYWCPLAKEVSHD